MKHSKAAVFAFLNSLRDSGATNMWGAPAYLEEHMDMNRHEASEWFHKWMDSFKRQAELDKLLRSKAHG